MESEDSIVESHSSSEDPEERIELNKLESSNTVHQKEGMELNELDESSNTVHQKEGMELT